MRENDLEPTVFSVRVRRRKKEFKSARGHLKTYYGTKWLGLSLWSSAVLAILLVDTSIQYHMDSRRTRVGEISPDWLAIMSTSVSAMEPSFYKQVLLNPWRPLTTQETEENAMFLEIRWRNFERQCREEQASFNNNNTKQALLTQLWNMFEPGFADPTLVPKYPASLEDGSKCPFLFIDLSAGETGHALTQLISSDVPMCPNIFDTPPQFHHETARMELSTNSLLPPFTSWISDAWQELFNRGYIYGRSRPRPEEMCYLGFESNPQFASRLTRLEHLVLKSKPRPVRYAHFFLNSPKELSKLISTWASKQAGSVVVIRFGDQEENQGRLLQELASSGVPCEFLQAHIQIDLYTSLLKADAPETLKKQREANAAKLRMCGVRIESLGFQPPYPAFPT